MNSKRVYLRKIVASDIQSVFLGLSNPEVIKYYGVSYKSLEATKEQMTWFSELEEKGKGVWWAVCTIDSNEFIGGRRFK